MNTIKAIENNKYRIQLLTDRDGMFYVLYNRNWTMTYSSDPIQDYKTASIVFDMRVEQMEGN